MLTKLEALGKSHSSFGQKEKKRGWEEEKRRIKDEKWQEDQSLYKQVVTHTQSKVKSYMILSNQQSERKEKPFDFDVIVTPLFQVP